VIWTPSVPCLHGVELRFTYGGLQHGRRVISASHLEPGRLGANLRFHKLWVEATEDRMFSNECRYHLQREKPPKTGERWGGRASLWEEKVVPVVEHELAVSLLRFGGFDQAWKATQSDRRYDGSKSAWGEAHDATLRLAYWEMVATTREMIEGALDAGLVEYRHDPLPLGKHPRTHLRPRSSSQSSSWVEIPTRMLIEGETVAWLGSDGAVYPLEDYQTIERRSKNP